MGVNEPASRYDEEHDVIVVGSGAGGMTAALCAKAVGLSAVVIEKDALFGGTSAVSGGGIWIPCNPDIPRVGGSDSHEEALTYLKRLIGDEVPLANIEAYLRNAPDMVRFLDERFGVKFRSVPQYPDYYAELPGGKSGFRSMEPAEFDASRLGAAFDTQRPSFRGTQLFGRIAMNQVEAHTLFSRGAGWIRLMLGMVLRYWFDFSWRRRTPRDRRQTLGQALTGSLREAMAREEVPLHLGTGLTKLIEQDGRVTGVEALRGAVKLRLRARRAVVLACGGFESNAAMRDQYLPKPTHVAWTAVPPINHGDGIRAGQALGAGLRHMDQVWGSPTVNLPGAAQQITLFIERGMPGCVAVNRRGLRFTNEASTYPDFLKAMYADDAKGNGTVPCWLIFDATFRYKYPMGIFLPGQIEPDSKLPADWLDKVYYRADSLAALASKIGVDAGNLAQTVQRLNGFAKTGIDAEFGKGNRPIDRYYSDRNVKPNPCLGPIEKAPFYAVRLDAGDIGTKGGLVTDERARVLRENGSVIEGLYAVGNTSAAVMGPTYAGAGSTLGPAMTFGYVAAHDIARAAVPETTGATV